MPHGTEHVENGVRSMHRPRPHKSNHGRLTLAPKVMQTGRAVNGTACKVRLHLHRFSVPPLLRPAPPHNNATNTRALWPQQFRHDAAAHRQFVAVVVGASKFCDKGKCIKISLIRLGRAEPALLHRIQASACASSAAPIEQVQFRLEISIKNKSGKRGELAGSTRGMSLARLQDAAIYYGGIDLHNTRRCCLTGVLSRAIIFNLSPRPGERFATVSHFVVIDRAIFANNCICTYGGSFGSSSCDCWVIFGHGNEQLRIEI